MTLLRKIGLLLSAAVTDGKEFSQQDRFEEIKTSVNLRQEKLNKNWGMTLKVISIGYAKILCYLGILISNTIIILKSDLTKLLCGIADYTELLYCSLKQSPVQIYSAFFVIMFCDSLSFICPFTVKCIALVYFFWHNIMNVIMNEVQWREGCN